MVALDNRGKDYILLIGGNSEKQSRLDAFFSENGFNLTIAEGIEDAQTKILNQFPSLVLFYQNETDNPIENFIEHLTHLGLTCPLMMIYKKSSKHPSQVEFSTDKDLKIDAYLPEDVPLHYLLFQVQNLVYKQKTIDDLFSLNRQLSKLSITDSLTDLYNHGYLMDLLSKEIKRSQRTLETLSCVMIDIDHFKSLNDTFGHQFGDFVLKEFALFLKDNIREVDNVGRYGGEEFLLILPNTTLQGAFFLAEKLREKIETTIFKDSKYECKITVSCGCASTSDQSSSKVDLLLQKTDSAMYQAKYSGRNRVIAFTNVDEEVSVSQNNSIQESPERKFIVHLISENHSLTKALKLCINEDEYLVKSYQDLVSYSRFFEMFPADLIIIDIDSNNAQNSNFLKEMHSIRKNDPVPLLLITNNKKLYDNSNPGFEDAELVDFEKMESSEFLFKVKLLVRAKDLQDQVREANSKLKLAQWRLMEDSRLKSLGQMSAGVAHDLNNILTAMVGRVQFLKSQITSKDWASFFDIIESSAKDGVNIINRLNKFSCPNRQSAMVPLKLINITEDSVQLTRPYWKDQAEKKGVHYSILSEIPNDIFIMGIESELHEIFINIILNALEAMPNGGSIKINAMKINDYVSIRITDTGCGMSPEVAKRCYEPFFSMKEKRGTGLGLSIVRELVKEHNGEISVESTLGKGTTFIINFPIISSMISKEPSVSNEYYDENIIESSEIKVNKEGEHSLDYVERKIP